MERRSQVFPSRRRELRCVGYRPDGGRYYLLLTTDSLLLIPDYLILTTYVLLTTYSTAYFLLLTCVVWATAQMVSVTL